MNNEAVPGYCSVHEQGEHRNGGETGCENGGEGGEEKGRTIVVEELLDQVDVGEDHSSTTIPF